MKITKRQLLKIIQEEAGSETLRESTGFVGDPYSSAPKLLDDMVSSLENKLISRMRIDEDEVDGFAIEFMNTVGTDIEKLLIKLLEGGYRQ